MVRNWGLPLSEGTYGGPAIHAIQCYMILHALRWLCLVLEVVPLGVLDYDWCWYACNTSEKNISV
jgi:hypothetical protein